MRKLLVLAISLLLVLTIASCGGNQSSNTTGNNAKGQADMSGEVQSKPSEDNSSGNSTGTESQNSLTGLMDKSKGIDNFSWECVYFGEGGTQQSAYKLWIKGGKNKLEAEGNGQEGTIMYTDSEKKEFYVYNEADNTAIKVTDDSMGQAIIKPDDFLLGITHGTYDGYARKGNESVGGIQCAVYEYGYSNSSVKLYVWEQYGSVLKAEFYEDGKLMSGYELKDYQVGNVTDDMVTIPANAQIMDLNNLNSN